MYMLERDQSTLSGDARNISPKRQKHELGR